MEEPIAPPIQVKYTQLLIDRQFVNVTCRTTFPTLDPRTGDLIVNVTEDDVEDMESVVKVTQKSFGEGPWPKVTAYER